MAHFAQLDSDNKVVNVIVVGDADCLDGYGNESEQVGVSFCQSLFGADTSWVKTSINNRIRKNYASIGYQYDSKRDAFIPPKPYDSWVLNEDTYLWEPPVPHPADDSSYYWDENTTNWVPVAQ